MGANAGGNPSHPTQKSSFCCLMVAEIGPADETGAMPLCHLVADDHHRVTFSPLLCFTELGRVGTGTGIRTCYAGTVACRAKHLSTKFPFGLPNESSAVRNKFPQLFAQAVHSVWA